MSQVTLFPDEPEQPRKSSRNVYSTLGASNHSTRDRADADLYCTHPSAVERLLELETFSSKIWEPCCGLGHISGVLEEKGHEVRKTDIISRRDDIETLDFLSPGNCQEWDGDIITNPPYSHATPIIYKALSLLKEGQKLAMWLRILFLESQERKKLFTNYPPQFVYISSKRIPCAMYGDFQNFSQSAQGYAWFVWEKGFNGSTTLKWF